MRINNNMMAMNTYRQLTNINAAASKSMEKLSSGSRINRAGDDAAGLAISEKMRGQIRGLNQASRNAQDGISLIQTAEGALGESQSILQKMREIAVQAASDTNTDADRVELQKEIVELRTELTRIGENTEFNTMSLLDGTFTDKKLQIGANSGQTMTIGIATAMTATGLGVDALDVSTQAGAEAAVATLDTATATMSGTRSTLGAWQNRLEHTVRNLDNSTENLQAAESRIRDVDMAKEIMNLTKNNILAQASQAMLAQANQAPQGVLQLLR
jgi:flagellin